MPASRRAWTRIEFDAIILHYSLFGMARYRLDEGFLRYLSESDAYKVAFFQDEYFACQRRFAFLNEYEIDCVYTCLEPDQFDQVYGRYTKVAKLVSTLTGYVSDHLLEAAGRFAQPDAERAVDVGYRGRPLPAYLGPRSPGEDADRRALRRARRRQRV